MARDPQAEHELLKLRFDREAAEKAAKAVKSEEKGVAKGAVAGVASSIVRGAVAIPALVRAAVPGGDYTLEDVGALDKDTKNLMGDKLIDPTAPGEATGFDAGNVLGDVAQMVLPTGGKAVAAVGVVGKLDDAAPILDDLTKVAVEQYQSMLRDTSKGGGDITQARQYLAVIGDYLKGKGVDVSKLRAEKPGEYNVGGMPKKTPEQWRVGPDGELEKNLGAIGVPDTQGQLNPMATAGMPPPVNPARSGDVLAAHGILAVRELKHWKTGKFLGNAYKVHQTNSKADKIRTAAKGQADGTPQFWLYDEKSGEVLVARRAKDGKLVLGKPTGKGAKRIEPYKTNDDGNYIRGKDGNPLLRDEIDFVVEKDSGTDALKWLKENSYDEVMELLDLK